MKLSARARYAARLLLDLAQCKGDAPVRASTLAENTDISVQFIEQILRPLKQAGYIKSIRGASGGHVLLKKPHEITLGGIVRAVEGDISLTHCCADPDTCERSEGCPTHIAWMHISDVIERELDSISLETLMQNPQSLLPDAQ